MARLLNTASFCVFTEGTHISLWWGAAVLQRLCGIFMARPWNTDISEHLPLPTTLWVVPAKNRVRVNKETITGLCKPPWDQRAQSQQWAGGRKSSVSWVLLCCPLLRGGWFCKAQHDISMYFLDVVCELQGIQTVLQKDVFLGNTKGKK